MNVVGAGRIRALLGPTNTGKTHRCIQSMLQHRSGMLGLPLRLLAQEVYDRVRREKGDAAVALITGEQRIVPSNPRYWICTTEAMPLDLPVAFVGVDEIQLCTHPDRGHVFTDRILRARGVQETMFLGSDSIQALLERMVPTVEIERLPRLSTLRHTGARRLLALPERSAVVAFSASDVYEHAERLRSRRGGTAVVMGALSPRARNAQVALYESGEVDYLVATDAIGMGLNLDIHHVALAARRKWDGRQHRDLHLSELAQVAGRAGRHRRDGTFGTLSSIPPLEADDVRAIEGHRFPEIKRVWFRHGELDFHTLHALLKSLREPPPFHFMDRPEVQVDEEVARHIAGVPALARRLDSEERVRLMWGVCQIPDFRKTLTGSHARLLQSLLNQLLDHGRVDPEVLADRFARLDNPLGDIETLMTRLAWTRTWSYVTQREDWLEDPRHWQQRAQALEDRLSDALHDQLTQRFVDTRPVVLLDGFAQLAELDRSSRRDETVGRLVGLQYRGELGAGALKGALRKSVVEEVARRVQALGQCDDEELTIDAQGRIHWLEGSIAHLATGKALRRPRVQLERNPLLDASAREALRRRLQRWLDGLLTGLLGSLDAPERMSAPARGILFAMEAGLGSAPRALVQPQLDALRPADRRQLAKRDVRLGTETIYVAGLLEPPAQRLRALLWSTWSGEPVRAPELPSVPALHSNDAYMAMGYRRLGGRAIRADVVERLAARARNASRRGPFRPTAEMAQWLSCDVEALFPILEDMGYRRRRGGRPQLERARRRR